MLKAVLWVASVVALFSSAAPAAMIGPIYPTDDATVFSSVPDFCYGAYTSLVPSKAYSESGQLTGERQVYLRFSLQSLTGYSASDIVSLKLHLFFSTSSHSYVDAWHSGSGWNEESITWNTKPALAGQPYLGPSEILTPTYSSKSVDLLANDSAWLGADLANGALSVALTIPATTTSTSYYFLSKEANLVFDYHWPYLEAQVIPEPETGALILLSLLGSRRRR